jgi:hypothetical protein
MFLTYCYVQVKALRSSLRILDANTLTNVERLWRKELRAVMDWRVLKVHFSFTDVYYCLTLSYALCVGDKVLGVKVNAIKVFIISLESYKLMIVSVASVFNEVFNQFVSYYNLNRRGWNCVTRDVCRLIRHLGEARWLIRRNILIICVAF